MGGYPGLSISTVALATLCAVIVIFGFFELFVNTTFWFLFNDVVPAIVLGRFLGLFRMVGYSVGALFNFVLFKHAMTHTALIFTGAALCYGTAFILLGLNVKEGTYPPPEPIADKKPSLVDYIKVFVRECFSHQIFRLVFVFSFMIGLMGGIGVFGIFMVRSLGLSLGEIGNISGFSLLAAILIMFPMGWLIDRFHPIRVLLAAQIGYVLTECILIVFLFFNFSEPVNFWIYAGVLSVNLPFYLILQSVPLPLVMRIFPKEQFGQFSAANAMCGALGAIVGGTLSGEFLDLMKFIFPVGDYYYRFVPVWFIFFIGLSGVATFYMLREWKRLGGDTGYVPPSVTKS